MYKKILNISLVVVLLAFVFGISSCKNAFKNPFSDDDDDQNAEELADNSNDSLDQSGIVAVSGSKVSYQINYDDSKWIVTNSDEGSDSEYEFEHVDGNVYALIIPERIEISVDSLKEIAFENAKAVAPDIQITYEETKTVNGRDVLAMKMLGAIDGMAFQYYGYYTTGTFGSVQFITYTTQNLALDYEEDFNELLNGLKIDDTSAALDKDITQNSSLNFVEGAKVDYKINYDENKWILEKSSEEEDSEYFFSHKDGDVYAMVIPERLEISLDSLKEIAIENAKSVAPDAEIVFEESREFKGQQIFVMKMNGTISGIPFQYYGYYLSGAFGTIQFITYTSQSLADTYEADATELLEGIEIVE